MNKKMLENHIKILGFKSKQEYGSWCKNSKLNSKINEKTKEDFERELALRDSQRIFKKNNETLKENNYENEIVESRVQLILSQIGKKVSSEERVQAYSFVRNVITKTGARFFDDSSNSSSLRWLSNCWRYREFWVNSVESFDCVYSNKERLLCNFTKHLFFKYNVSMFWSKALMETPEEALLAIEYSQGKSLKELTIFNYQLSNKEVGLLTKFSFVDYTTSFKADFHYILFLAWAENDTVAKIASRSSLSEGRAISLHKDFWEQFFMLFRTQMFNSLELRELIDFLYQQKSAITPENINFSIKNRSLTSLLQQSHDWHQNKKKEKVKFLVKTFEKKWENWELDLSVENPSRWLVGQIYTEKDLYLEGEAMSHCVYSYLNSCITGACQIFSLRKNGQRVATLEVRGKSVVQARKKRNARLNAEEIMVVEEWVKENKMTFSDY